MPKLSEILFGKSQKTEQTPTISPQMQELLDMIMQGIQGQGQLAGTFGDFNQQEFDKGITEPALKNFQEKILPLLQEKFVASGGLGSGANQRAKALAGSDLQSQLAQLMYQAQQGQKQNQQQGVNSVLGTRPFENIIQGAQTGAIPAAIQGFSQQAGRAAGASIAG